MVTREVDIPVKIGETSDGQNVYAKIVFTINALTKVKAVRVYIGNDERAHDSELTFTVKNTG